MYQIVLVNTSIILINLWRFSNPCRGNRVVYPENYIFYLNVQWRRTLCINLSNRKQKHNSNRGNDSVFMDTTRDILYRRCAVGDLSTTKDWTLIGKLYVYEEELWNQRIAMQSSRKTCLENLIIFDSESGDTKLIHSLAIKSGNSSRQLILDSQSPCI